MTWLHWLYLLGILNWAVLRFLAVGYESSTRIKRRYYRRAWRHEAIRSYELFCNR